MSTRPLPRTVARVSALLLPLFVLVEVNYPHLTPQGELAIFTLLGFVVIFATRQRSGGASPAAGAGDRVQAAADVALAALAAVVCGYIVVQTEPWFRSLWLEGQTLGDRAGIEQPLDIAIGVLGLALVLAAARRSIGWTLPLLALLFMGYARFGRALPDWLLPHRGYGVDRIVSQTFLHSQGVFGIALSVMFSYVFLFVVFGALLEATGATGFVIQATRGLFRRSAGGPAKVAVLSSGLMGSLSGSAVANTATTGTFTIPMMKGSGLAPHLAAGLEAAASSGGALVPPVMGAGAYMMLEIVDPPVTYLEIIRAALIPALLYYFSLFLIVHLWVRGGEIGPETVPEPGSRALRFEGLVFLVGLGGLVAFLLAGFSVFRAVSLAMAVVILVSSLHPRTRLDGPGVANLLVRASLSGVALISAAACVGIILGVVTLTGLGARLPALILPLAQEHLTLALIALMLSSVVLGMGLPSAVCYLLLATVVGPVLGKLGVAALAAHLFIFYFGLMSMVTPPVALAAYAASSIAHSNFLRSSAAAFRFAAVGFVLPYVFVFRPALLMLDRDGAAAPVVAICGAAILCALGLVPFAAASAGYLRGPLSWRDRALLLVAALAILLPGPPSTHLVAGLGTINVLGLLAAGLFLLRRPRKAAQSAG